MKRTANRQQNNSKQRPTKVVASFVMLGVTALVCFLTVFTWLFTTDAFGWFVKSKTPYSNDISLNTLDGYDMDMLISSDGSELIQYENRIISVDIMDNIFCGSANSRTITLKHTNNENKDLYIWWYFGIPNLPYGGVETPHTESGKYYYLGSQLAITDITVTVNDAPRTVAPAVISGKGKFLLPTAPQGGGQVTFVQNAVASMPRVDLIEGMTLEAGKTTIITLTLTFVDNGENQSIYQNFAGDCSRQLYFKLLENAL